MILREATTADIPQIQIIRNSVVENMLSDPSLVTNEDCDEYLNRRGKGWVFEIDDRVVGFSIVDMVRNNVWALFVHPSYEKKGVGKKLHDQLLSWYFSHSSSTIWLGTAPGTRAEKFYRKAGWKEVGLYGKDEIKFEMNYNDWIENRATP